MKFMFSKIWLIIIIASIGIVTITWLSLSTYFSLDKLSHTPFSDVSWAGTQLETAVLQYKSSLLDPKTGNDQDILFKSWKSVATWRPSFEIGGNIEKNLITQDQRKALAELNKQFLILKQITKTKEDIILNKDVILSTLDQMKPLARYFAVELKHGVVDLDGRLRHDINDHIVILGIVLILTISSLIFIVITLMIQMTRLKSMQIVLSIAKEEADRANRIKGNFLANMSHELRTPLNAIIGFSEMMTAKIFGPVNNPYYEEYVTHILHSGKYLLDLINKILDLSRIEHGKLECNPEVFDLGKLLLECMQMISVYSLKKQLGTSLVVSTENNMVFADQGHVRQILLNLISNAVKFTDSGGTIELGCNKTNHNIETWVKDNGKGFDLNKLNTYLEPFGRENRSELAQDGTGLGLPLCKSLAELNKIKLEFETTAGGGCTVKLIFPLISSSVI